MEGYLFINNCRRTGRDSLLRERVADGRGVRAREQVVNPAEKGHKNRKNWEWEWATAAAFLAQWIFRNGSLPQDRRILQGRVRENMRERALEATLARVSTNERGVCLPKGDRLLDEWIWSAGLLKRRRSSQQTTQPIVISASPHRSNQGYIEYITQSAISPSTQTVKTKIQNDSKTHQCQVPSEIQFVQAFLQKSPKLRPTSVCSRRRVHQTWWIRNTTACAFRQRHRVSIAKKKK